MGPHTATVIQWFLQQHKVEQQGYKACMALLKLSDKYSVERIENACERVLSFTLQPGLKNIQAVLRSGQDKLLHKADTSQPTPDTSPYGFTRGAGYYDSGRDGEC
jgi:hypothetical protein